MTKPVNIATYLAAAMLTTYYFNDPEEALRRAKAAFAVYEDGKVVERYAININNT